MVINKFIVFNLNLPILSSPNSVMDKPWFFSFGRFMICIAILPTLHDYEHPIWQLTVVSEESYLNIYQCSGPKGWSTYHQYLTYTFGKISVSGKPWAKMEIIFFQSGTSYVVKGSTRAFGNMTYEIGQPWVYLQIYRIMFANSIIDLR